MFSIIRSDIRILTFLAEVNDTGKNLFTIVLDNGKKCQRKNICKLVLREIMTFIKDAIYSRDTSNSRETSNCRTSNNIMNACHNRDTSNNNDVKTKGTPVVTGEHF